MHDYEKLVGHTIMALAVSEGESDLVFSTSSGMVVWNTEGECCSESWFADVTGVDALIGGRVASVEEIALPGYNVNDGRGRQDEDSAYGYKITTDKGVADIVFRNSSNGYYGGWMNVVDQVPATTRPITSDWHA